MLIKDILNSSKDRWSREEFVHASLIMINFHRIANIVESLRPNVNEIINSEFDKLNLLNNYDDEEKKKLFNNIQMLNEEDTGEFKVNNRKSSEDDKINSLNNSFTSEVENSDSFQKHISNYCTLYLDFDTHSDNFHSAIVKLINIKILGI